jgi:hypothetical protein
MDFNPEISLKMANSLLSEVIEEIEPFQQALQQVDAGVEDAPFLQTDNEGRLSACPAWRRTHGEVKGSHDARRKRSQGGTRPAPG